MALFNNNFTEFELDSDAYAAFDASSLRDLIINRLNTQGVFTDQIYKGSNISTIIDIIAYSYHVLLFYLNRTSNEGLFSEAQIYENINRIVKLINYKPVGYQTSILTFNATASNNLNKGLYTIPRYSFIKLGNIKYSFIKDATFSKTVVDSEEIKTLGLENVLYQGEYIEHPEETATGDDFELFTIAVDKDTKIEGSSINAYVRDYTTGKYSEFFEVESLLSHGPSEKVYEKRYNEGGYYELRFGDGVNGTQLNPNDTVHIYYIKSNDTDGVVEANAFKNTQVFLYKTPKFNTIKSDITEFGITYLDFNNIETITISNTIASTTPKDRESVAEIRRNAPKTNKSQQRLISKADFELKATTSFGNILQDVKVLDNMEYVDNYMKYFSELTEITYPSLESRILTNHVLFSSPVGFNNVYIIGVPRVENRTSVNIQSNFLAPSQKQLIRNEMDKNKVIGAEIVFADPVFTAFDICAATAKETLTSDLITTSRLVVEPEDGFVLNKESIKQSVTRILLDYFKNENCKLNQLIDFTELSNAILNVKGVKSFYTSRTDIPNTKLEGLNLLVWNPVYESSDIQLVNQTMQLPVYKFPYWFDIQGIAAKIIIK